MVRRFGLCLRLPLPAPRQHIQHVRDLAAVAQVSEVPAMVVNRYPGTQRGIQPRQLALIEDQVVAVRLRV